MLTTPGIDRFELVASKVVDDEASPLHATEADQKFPLEDLPDEMLDRIAGYLPMRSLQALACVNKRLGASVDAEREKIELKRQALPQDILQFSWTSGLDTFRSLLATIRRLRPVDQTESLQALCARLDRLPTAQRKMAAASVLVDASGLSERVVNRLKILASHGSATEAVIAGENIHAIKACFEPGDCQSKHLEWAARSYGPAIERIVEGADSRQVERDLGFSNPLDPTPYAAWFYIDTRRAARQGTSVDHLDTPVNPRVQCDERALSDKEREGLMLDAAEGVAGEAATHGENIDVIAGRHGIRTPEARMILERAAYVGAAGERVAAGEQVATVAAHHGIRSAPYLLALLGVAMNGAAGDPVRTGEKTVEQVAQAQGLDLSTLSGTTEKARSLHWGSLLPCSYARAMFESGNWDMDEAAFLRHEATSTRRLLEPRV